MQSTRERLSIRAAVFLGFGLIFGLWMFAWMQLSLRIGEAQGRAQAINTQYLKAQETLANIRTQWLVEARNVLSRRVTPRRDIIIAVSEGVQALNRAGYMEQQSEIGSVYRSVQRDLWQVLGL